MKKILLPLVIIMMLTSSIWGASYQKPRGFDCGFSGDSKSGLHFTQGKWNSERDDSYSDSLKIDFGIVQPNSVYTFARAINLCNTGSSRVLLTMRDDNTNGNNGRGNGVSVQVTAENYNCTRQYCWSPLGQKNPWCNSPGGITLECNKKLSQNYAYVTFTITTPYDWHAGDRSTVIIQFILTQIN